jgi:Zn-dependent protease
MLEKFLRWLERCQPMTKATVWLGLFFSSLLTVPLFIYIFFLINFVHASAQTIVGLGWLFLAMMTVHELGHLYAAKIIKVPTGGLYFLSFLGAVTVVNKEKLPMPVDHAKDYFFSAAGSVTSLLALWLAIAIISFLHLSCPNVVLVLAFWCFVSLFNLLPAYPYDGGRMFLDLTAGVKQFVLVSRLVGVMAHIALSVLLWKAGGQKWVIVLTITLIWLSYLFLSKRGKIDPSDRVGKPMTRSQLLIGTVVYLALISAYWYSMVWLTTMVV